MMNYLARRIAFFIPLCWVIATLSFFLVRIAPGGPFDRERAPAAPQVEAALKRKYHLDEPVWRQYLRYLGALWEREADGRLGRIEGGLLTGDLGLSLKYRNHTVADLLRQGLPVSMTLGWMAFGLAISVGAPLGFVAAARRGRLTDWAASGAALMGVCVPGFVIGPALALGFGLKLRWFPVALWGSPAHAVLPTIALGLYFAGRVARLTREGMLQVLHSEFLRTARAKGLSEFAVLTRHAMPLAALPLVSYSGPMLADLLTGSFVIENIFQIPGVGVSLVNSSLNRDYTMVIGLVLVYAVLLLALNLLVDLAYGLIDPRIRHD